MPNISTWTELNAIRNDENYLYNSYYLIADLKTSDGDYTGIGDSWTPLPNDFGGMFDGTGHYIEGLSNALFMTTNGATVQRLGLKDVSIITSSEIGALVVSAMSSNIVNCWATGTVTNNGGYPTGGLIGSTYYSTGVSNCYCDVAVTSNNFDACGGLVGNMQGSIVGCFSVGVVTYNTEVAEFGGGLVGITDTQPTGCGWVTTTCAQAIGNVNGSYPGTVDYSESTEAPYYSSSHLLYAGWDFTNTWHTNVDSLPTTNSIGLTPTAPVLSIATATDSSVGLVWEASVAVGGEILGYKIDRALKSDGIFSVLVANTGSVDVEYSDETVETGIEYLYKVYGISYAGTSSASNTVGTIAKTPSVNFLDDGIEIPNGAYHYFGDSSTNGSLRIFNSSGTYTCEKRILGVWTEVSLVDLSNYLAKDNTDEYTPDADYEPATKKYVDDNAGGEGTPQRTLATFVFDGNYASPTVGTITNPAVVGYSGTITGWYISNADSIAKVASSIVLKIYKNGVEISGTEKPTLSSQTSNSDTSLSTWTTSFVKGDEFVAYVESASTGIRYTCVLYAEASS